MNKFNFQYLKKAHPFITRNQKEIVDIAGWVKKVNDLKISDEKK